MRKPKRFTGISNPELSHDGENLAVIIEAADDSLDVEIPFNELGAIIEFLVAAANYDTQPGTRPAAYSPIPIQGLGLAHGATPDQTLLVLRLGATDLAFSLDNTKLAELGAGLSQKLLALSAHSSNPH